jgi:ubiquinone/menaquinone biosynthesis C-methylase UbiE
LVERPSHTTTEPGFHIESLDRYSFRIPPLDPNKPHVIDVARKPSWSAATVGFVVVDRDHWEHTYAAREPDRVSWFQDLPARSIELIEAAKLERAAGIIDVGGGASSLAAELLKGGHTDVTVADISAGALERARDALGQDSRRVRWLQADVRMYDFARTFELWHDRAVFHFMVTVADREAYLATLRRALAPGRHLVILTFGPAGPTQCSGPPVQRYDIDALRVTLGPQFSVLSSGLEAHKTPSGNQQQFLYAHLARVGDSGERGS